MTKDFLLGICESSFVTVRDNKELAASPGGTPRFHPASQDRDAA